MRIIGLTGGIACGKSHVSDCLRSEGCRIIDGDRISRALTAPGAPLLGPIRETFGDTVFAADGTLNRAALGRLVFSDPQQLQRLNSLMQPWILQRIEQELEQARNDPQVRICVLDMPLLFEQRLNRLCERIWCVYLPHDLQLERLMARDGSDAASAQQRIASQMDTSQKARLSDVVIDNSGSKEETRARVHELLAWELAHADDVLPVRQSPRRRTAAASLSPTPAPQPQTPARPAEAPDAEPEPIARTQRRARPITESVEPVEDTPESVPMAQPLRRALVILSVLLVFCLAGGILMQAYLDSRARAREAAHQAILAAHPVRYQELIEEYAGLYGLQPAYVTAIILNESSFDCLAESSVGARGLMQLMEDTAGWIAGKLRIKDYSFDTLWDPETNVRFGCWYLNYLASLFEGDPVAVTAAYHAGQGTVSQWLTNTSYTGGGRQLIPDLLPEGPTKVYVGRVTRAYGIYDALYYHALNPVPDAADDSAVTGTGDERYRLTGRGHSVLQDTVD